MSERAFRFGLQIFDAPSAAAAVDLARRAEQAGFDAILMADHVVAGLLAPLPTLAMISAVTTDVRLGTFVLNNDFRHPALVARDAATLDLVSDGRFDLGIGAGHAAPEYAELGVPFEPAGRRVDRLEESVAILRRLFDGDEVTVAGQHYQFTSHRLYPPRTPRVLVGGNGDRVLRCAARYADVVGFTGLGRTLPDGQRHEQEWEPEQIDRKVDVVREAAGARVADLELNALVQYVEITDDRGAAAARLAAHLGGDPARFLATPYVWLGSVGEIVDGVQRARARWGFTYFVTRDLDATASVIAALRAGA